MFEGHPHSALWRMHHVEGLSFGEIGRRVGISRSAAIGRVLRMGPPPRPPVTTGLLRLAEFDPLARRLVEQRT